MKSVNSSIKKMMKLGVRVVCLSTLVAVASCEDFLDVDLTNSQVTSDLVFSNDITATSAVTGIYYEMLQPDTYSCGSYQSISSLGGLSADELIYYSETPDFSAFEQNELDPTNSNVMALWKSLYKTIYSANAVLQGLDNSTEVTLATKDQLRGEAFFVRALANFYLVNLFGDVPLILTTDYVTNAKATRTSSAVVYDQIVIDLTTSATLLGEDYPTLDDDFFTSARVRPNKYAAKALLARVYLYLEEWSNAELQASDVIEHTMLYNLEGDLNSVFLKNSMEAIWQLRQVYPDVNTWEGNYFIVTSTPQYSVLNEMILSSFEVNDERLTNWISSFDTGAGIVYFPFKYKIQSGSDLSEYSMVLRLAEQYLIRAEARAKQNNLSGCIADIDVIRDRAGLVLIQDSNPSISAEDLLLAIEQERRVELFTEWGHRWLDLKRYTLADERLQPIKPDWDDTDTLYPIPQSERSKNQNLSQNSGY